MNCISSDGPMKLMKVVNVYSKIHASRSINEIHFKDSVLAVMNQHAFSGYRDDNSIVVKADQIKKGDKIWIDSSAFSADGSLRGK